MSNGKSASGGERASFDAARYVRKLTARPGVYRMLDARGKIIYVGKARNLKARVGSYFNAGVDSAKTAAMVAHVAGIEVTVTQTETEALLLEDALIKRHRPRYNILLRDDKSYPWIRVTGRHAFPRLAFHRGARRPDERYFGPYPSAKAVRESLNLLQKLFQLRSCDDSFFANRSRPCLQHQIKRCSAPCVGLIGEPDYAADVEHAVLFLEGRNREVTADLAGRMEKAAAALDFERAAQYRDQIATLKRIEERQFVSGAEGGDFDVLAAVAAGPVHCVASIVIRAGRNLGTRTYFPRTAGRTDPAEVLGAFLPQHYLSRDAPREILCNVEAPDTDLVERALSERTGHRVEIRHRLRGRRARWVKMAVTNAEYAAKLRATSQTAIARQADDLRDALGLDETPKRIECFDISHTGGESTVASCVVFDEEGPRKSDYRRFNIDGLAPGDDYGAMNQALRRRYTRLKRGEAPLPDLLVIDGGKGQVAQALTVLDELQLPEVQIVGVAKGPTRKPGMEQLVLPGRERPVRLAAASPGLHLLQQVRDEAHRFAIAGHRQRRAKTRNTSVLESIPGLGPKRRRELLRAFGGLKGIERAGVDDLGRVRGISHKLARLIYETFHPGG